MGRAMRFRTSSRGAWSSSSPSEIAEADRFYADLMGWPTRARPRMRARGFGETADPSTGSAGPLPSPSSAPPSPGAPTCIRVNREPDFAASVTAPIVLDHPHSAICKILVLKRVRPLARFGIVDAQGRPVEEPVDRDDRGEDPPGPWGSITAPVTGLLEGMGTGFFVRPDRIVTAAHVVLGATQLVVIPAKNGPGMAAPGATHSDEPFGRLALPAAAVKVFPRAMIVATRPLPSIDDFFAQDLAIVRLVPRSPPGRPPAPPPFPPALGHFRPAPPPARGTCVNTSGYSAETVDPNFQHTDLGRCTGPRAGGRLIGYDLLTEKGASGSPIWAGPFMPPRPSPTAPPTARACGIVLGGNSRLDTFSLVFDASKIGFATR